VKVVLILILFFIFSCNSNKSSSDEENKSQPIVRGKYEGTASLLSDTVVHTHNSDLYGLWTDGSTENATFEIRKDSIYYVEQFAAYKYVLDEDFITIYYPDTTYRGRLKIVDDELEIVSEDGSTTFKKFND
jgi:hypothetical protein